MKDEQKTPEPPEGFEIVTDEYRLANGYPRGDGVMFFVKTQPQLGWRDSLVSVGWTGRMNDAFLFAVKLPPDIPTQVGAIAERCARISKTTEHSAFLALYTHVDYGYVALQVYIGGWHDPVSEEKYRRADFRDDANLAARANRWLDKVLAEAAEAGAVE